MDECKAVAKISYIMWNEYCRHRQICFISYRKLFSFPYATLDLVLVNGHKLIGMLCKQTSYKMVKSKHSRKETEIPEW